MTQRKWLIALTIAVTMVTGAATRAEARKHRDKIDVRILDDATPEAIVSVIQYLNPVAMRPGTKLYQRYYTPEKLTKIAEAIVETCNEYDHPVALYVAYFHEQSRFQDDAVSRWNRCEPGEPHCTQVGDDWYRRVPNKVAWKDPVRGLDYGLAQIHYPANRLLTQDDVKKLKDPVFAVRTFARWLERNSAFCRKANTARCREMEKLTGWSWHRRPGGMNLYLRQIMEAVRGKAKADTARNEDGTM